jgi:hypothetical protein
LLHVAPGELDVARFESLIAAALTRDDPVDRSARLRDALSLWRGEPLADLHGEAFAEREIARLEELRLAALEDRSTPTWRSAATASWWRSSSRSSPSTCSASGCAVS